MLALARLILSSNRREALIEEVLARTGEADDASRVAILQRGQLAAGPARLKQMYQWESARNTRNDGACVQRRRVLERVRPAGGRLDLDFQPN